MDLQPNLEDDLIILRPLLESDFEALYEVAKDPLIWEQHPCSNRWEKDIYTDFFEDSIASKGALIIIDKSNSEVIGSTRFKTINASKKAIEIGWSFLSREKWGGTYNKSMKKLMIDYALNHVDHIIFYIGEDNMRSQKAVQKLGGELITNPDLKELVKDSASDLTFRIGKENWK